MIIFSMCGTLKVCSRLGLGCASGGRETFDLQLSSLNCQLSLSWPSPASFVIFAAAGSVSEGARWEQRPEVKW